MKRTLSIFAILFLFASTFAQTVNIGSGSGILEYDGTGVTLSRLNILHGTYTRIVLSNVHGVDAAHPVLIINSGGQVISNGSSAPDAGLELGGGLYLHVSGTGTVGVTYGFLLTGGPTGSFNAHYGSSDIEIDHIECAGSGYGGLMFRTYPSEGCQWSVSGGWAIHNMIIHDNYIHDVSGEGMYLGQSHYGNVVANGYDPVNNPLVQQGYACAGGNESPIIGAQIYHNLVQHVGYDGIQLSGCISGCSITQNIIQFFAEGQTDGQDGGITFNPGSVGTIDRNWIEYAGSGPAMGIMYQGQGDSYLTNNVLVGSLSGSGFNRGIALLRNTIANVSGSTHQNIYIYNNDILNFPIAYSWFGDNGFSTKCYWSNNLVVGPTFYEVQNGSISNLQRSTYYETTSSVAAKFTNFAGHDFTLTTGSPAIDAGTTYAAVTTDYTGTALTGTREIGAFQFGTGPALPTNRFILGFKIIKGVAYFDWQTQFEQNNDHFEVELSEDGFNWNTVGVIESGAAGGNSNIPIYYHYKYTL